MRTFVGLSVAVTAATARKPRWNELEGYTFEAFVEDHGKAYSSEEEKAHRKQIFNKNLNKIRQLNAKPGMTWRAGVNMFTDATEGEFKDFNKAKSKPTSSFEDLEKEFDKVHRAPAAEDPPLPHEVDWRESPGVLGPVRHQGNCGSCWAHAAAETISSQYNILTGTHTLLSVGQINDCTPKAAPYGCYGCDGGFAAHAYRYLKDTANNTSASAVQQSLTEEWAYPFQMADFFSFDNGGGTEKCQDISKKWKNGNQKKFFAELNAAGVSGIGVVDSNSAAGGPAAMKALREVGPLSINVAAGNWQWYTEGVLKNTNSTGADAEWQIDHAVQMVGYGYDKELDENYWIVRNSWSTLWGEGGYVRLWRAKDGEDEPCNTAVNQGAVCGTAGCLNDITYPIVYKAMPIKFG